jgi:carbon monoxide dehydrogenase subunit G
LQEIEGETYRGIVKVKVGPIQAQFKGQASFVEQDHVAHRVVLKGEGRDTTGKGNASALITAELTSLNASSTSVKVLTDLSITGKVAQFGRGAMADISDKLLAQFVENLNTLIGEQQASPAPAAPAPAAATTEEDEAPQIRKIDAPEAEALDLLSVSSGAIVKRAIPVVIAIAAVVIWLVVR